MPVYVFDIDLFLANREKAISLTSCNTIGSMSLLIQHIYNAVTTQMFTYALVSIFQKINDIWKFVHYPISLEYLES